MSAKEEIFLLLRQVGAREIFGRKHHKYRLPDGTNYILPKTPSDVRGWDNNLSDLRKRLGIKREKIKAATKRRKMKDYLPEKAELSNAVFGQTLAEKLGLAVGLVKPPLPAEVITVTSTEPEPEPIKRRPRHYKKEQSEKTKKAYSLPPEVIAEANRHLREGGQEAYRNYMATWNKLRTHEADIGQPTSTSETGAIHVTQTEDKIARRIARIKKLLATAVFNPEAAQQAVELIEEEIKEQQQILEDAKVAQSYIDTLTEMKGLLALSVDVMRKHAPTLAKQGVVIDAGQLRAAAKQVEAHNHRSTKFPNKREGKNLPKGRLIEIVVQGFDHLDKHKYHSIKEITQAAQKIDADVTYERVYATLSYFTSKVEKPFFTKEGSKYKRTDRKFVLEEVTQQGAGRVNGQQLELQAAN